MDFELVRLRPEEWPRYRELRLEALRTEPQAFGASFAESARRPDLWWQGRLEEAAEGMRSWLLFAQAEGRLVGMVGAYVQDDPAGVELISLYVAARERGRGIARALLDAQLSVLAGAGRFRRVTLAVNEDQAAALALYLASGFRIEGERTAPMGDGLAHRELRMSRPLDLG